MDPSKPRPLRDYLLNKIPDTQRIVMKHGHWVENLERLRRSGIVFQESRFPMAASDVNFQLTYTDIKQLEAGETIHKQYDCPDCKAHEEYSFRVRRPDEQMSWTTRRATVDLERSEAAKKGIILP